MSPSPRQARFLDRIRFLAPRRWHGLVAFNYHRIGDPAGSPFDHELWSATAEELDRQVSFLRQEFDVVHPRDLPGLQRAGRGRHALITFDDGYRDNHQLAFPVFRHHRVPAVFFVTTGFLDGRRVAWWDEIAWMIRRSPRAALEPSPWWNGALALDGRRTSAIHLLLRNFKALPSARGEEFLEALGAATGTGRCPVEANAGEWMTWDMVREMRDGGMAIGGHTESHPKLARMDPEGQGVEIATCARRFREELGEPMRWFAYPVGGLDAFDAHTRRHLAQAGVELAFTYYGGYRRFDGWDPLDVRRMAVEPDLAGEAFRAMALWPGLAGAPRARGLVRRVGDTLRDTLGL